MYGDPMQQFHMVVVYYSSRILRAKVKRGENDRIAAKVGPLGRRLQINCREKYETVQLSETLTSNIDN